MNNAFIVFYYHAIIETVESIRPNFLTTIIIPIDCALDCVGDKLSIFGSIGDNGDELLVGQIGAG